MSELAAQLPNISQIESGRWQELAQRQNGGLEVFLRWCKFRQTDVVEIIATDTQTGHTDEFLVEPEKALDAFYHPYAYIAEVGAVIAPPTETT